MRDEFLTLFAGDGSMPGCVHRALRRGLWAAALDLRVQHQMLDAMTAGKRPWLAAAALSGARASSELCDRLVALVHDAKAFDPSSMWGAFDACAHLPRVTEAVLRLLEHKRGITVQGALRIVGGGMSAAARQGVLSVLDHPENYIRWLAIERLQAHIADPTIQAALCARLPCEDENGRMNILTALGASNGPKTRAAIESHLADPSPPVAVAAARGLGGARPDPAAWAVLRDHVGALAPDRLYRRARQADARCINDSPGRPRVGGPG